MTDSKPNAKKRLIARYRGSESGNAGRYLRQKDSAKSAHVLKAPDGRWAVRTIGLKGDLKVFDAKDQALGYANKLRAAGSVSRIQVHGRINRSIKEALVRETEQLPA